MGVEKPIRVKKKKLGMWVVFSFNKIEIKENEEKRQEIILNREWDL